MNKFIILLSLIFSTSFTCKASTAALDSLETLFRDHPQVQEKVYLHFDNNCYFIGDTLWYKAYVVRSDDFHPTNLSKLLYVELLNPDGIVVERQHVVISDKGLTCGQFYLEDSLYSGYYEVRAYTKYDLNFNVTEREYNFIDERRFFNKQMCKDFFRQYDGLYSRVVPVYEKPKTTGEYSQRYMSKRPKQHVLKEKQRIYAHFYPEGGISVQGQPCRIAFEITDQDGQGINIDGILTDGTRDKQTKKLIPTQTIKSTYLGRGTFTYTPNATTMKAAFTWNGKEYTFNLPEVYKGGTTLTYNPEKQSITLHSLATSPAAYAVLCRGKLIDFKRINDDGTYTLTNGSSLPTGVNEVIVYDGDAQPLCSRLFFINNHDMGKRLDIQLTGKEGSITKTTTLSAYSPIDLQVNAASSASVGNDGKSLLRTVSIAIRDTQTDDPAYDDGNIMTDMLLGSELKGFVASPAYYFSADDQLHRQRLDELMMIQGWHRYARVEKLRYNPELTTTFDGTVYKLPASISMLELEDISSLNNSTTVADEMLAEQEAMVTSTTTADEDTSDETSVDTSILDEEVSIEAVDEEDRRDGKRVKKPVYVEAELTKIVDETKSQTAGAISKTDKNGHFSIQIPPYYDKAILFVKAYAVKDSAQKCMANDNKGRLDERQYPDYYVKRDMFFPVFANKYSWYQINSPDLFFIDEEDDQNIPANSKLAGDHMLQTVIVKAHRRGKRAIDMTKPAIVRDAYDAYNDVTDYGLSFGVFNMANFPQKLADMLYGNMGRLGKQFNIRAMIYDPDNANRTTTTQHSTFYRNYTPLASEFDVNMSDTKKFELLHLNRIQDIRIYTDYELRSDSGYVEETQSPAVTMDFIPVANNGKRYTYRDRRYIFPGIAYSESFYSPDYSSAVPIDPKDYRRTLYWNPNAKLDKDGSFHTTLYNNCRETRITVSAAGIDSQGQMYW